MRNKLGIGFGLIVGLGIGLGYRGTNQPVFASNDRHEDFVLCTGPVSVQPEPRPTVSGCSITAPDGCSAP